METARSDQDESAASSRHMGQSVGPNTTKEPSLRVVARAIELLETLSEQPMRPSELCKSLGLPWTSVYRLVQQLADKQFIEREPRTGQYRIGQACWLVGSAYTINHPVLDIARPGLELLASRVDAVLQLCERAGRHALTLLSVHTSRSESVPRTYYGYPLPLHCSSKGQVLLAFSGGAFIDWYLSTELERLTPDTVTDPVGLREMLVRIREQGYAHTEGGVLRGSASIAVPVFGRDQHVVASICATARCESFADEESTIVIVEQLRAVAFNVSSAIGWRPSASTH